MLINLINSIGFIIIITLSTKQYQYFSRNVRLCVCLFECLCHRKTHTLRGWKKFLTKSIMLILACDDTLFVFSFFPFPCFFLRLFFNLLGFLVNQSTAGLTCTILEDCTALHCTDRWPVTCDPTPSVCMYVSLYVRPKKKNLPTYNPPKI